DFSSEGREKNPLPACPHSRIFRQHRKPRDAKRRTAVMSIPLEQRGPIGNERTNPSMARKTKRPRGAGEVQCLKDGSYAIRWREPELQDDGSIKRVRKYEALGHVSYDHAQSVLSQKQEKIRKRRGVHPRPGRTFKDHATYWERNIFPMKHYKNSTR